MVFEVGAARAVVVLPPHAHGDRAHQRACASRVAASIPAGVTGLAIGVACAPEDGQSLAALVRVAEQRLGLVVLGADASAGTCPPPAVELAS